MDLLQNRDTSIFGFGFFTNKSNYEIWELKQQLRFQQQAQEQMAMEAQTAMGGLTGDAGMPPIEQPSPDMRMALQQRQVMSQQGLKPPREDEAKPKDEDE